MKSVLGPRVVDVPDAAFREMWAAFPAGVTIITSADKDGVPRGLTCTAVTPVSAEPPLLLVVVHADSNTLPAIRRSNAFVVNFMADGTEDVSRLFASKSQDKFARTSWRPSEAAGGAPILTEGTVSSAECLVESLIRCGDHDIFVGRIVGATTSGGSPLMYFRRTFYTLRADGSFQSNNT